MLADREFFTMVDRCACHRCGITPSTYDPAQQWHPKLEWSKSTGSTHIFSGHIVGNSKVLNLCLQSLMEDIGHERQSKVQSQLQSTMKAADKKMQVELGAQVILF